MSVYYGHSIREPVTFVRRHVIDCDGVEMPTESEPNWGYGGAGPMLTALTLLLAETDEETAARLAWAFKVDVVSGFPASWTLTSEDIQAWLAKQRLSEEARAKP